MGAGWDAITFGRWRRGRKMMRRLRKLDRADARAIAAGRDPYDDWMRSRVPVRAGVQVELAPERGVGRTRSVMIVIVVLGLAIGAIVLMGRGSPSGHTVARHRVGVPPAGHDEHKQPLGVPQPPPAMSGAFRFTYTQPSGHEPVTWDPCRPIHYVVTGVPPAGGTGLLASALRHVSAVTGLQFVDDGSTTEPVTTNREPYQPGRYGSRWAPVLIAWTTPAQVPDLAGQTVGLGGGIAVAGADQRRTYVSGIVFLDGPQFATELGEAGPTPKPSRQAAARAVILHEVGHLLGLAHVSDPSQVMYPETTLQVTDYGAGDLRGLYALSTGRCAPDL